MLIFASTHHTPPSHLLTLLIQLREYELEREFPTERENKVKSEASKYRGAGLDNDQKYKYNIGLDETSRNEVVEFVPLVVPEKTKQIDHPRTREHMSNEIPLVPVTNRRIGLGKSSLSKGFRAASSKRFNKTI